MRIAVMGVGSIGGYFGGKLALAGNEVTLIARGSNKEALTANGLRVVTDVGEFTVRCAVSNDPKQVGSVDLVLLTVKTYHNQQALPSMLPLLDDHTTTLCLQNGIDSYQQAAQALGAERVLPGVAYIEASHPAPGVVQQTGGVVRIVFGEEDGSESERGRRILRTLRQAGIEAELSGEVQKELWSKFLFIATLAGITSLAQEELAQLLPRPEWRQVVVNCLKEIEAVGRAAGVNLDASIVADTLSYMEAELEQMHASMRSDIMAGRPLELEALTGAVVRAGRAAGMATPINDVIYAMLKPYAMGQNE